MTRKRIFLDSADIGEIEFWSRTDLVSGVTTNPSLIARSPKGDYLKLVDEICRVMAKRRRPLPGPHLSVEVTEETSEEMVKQGNRMCAMASSRCVDLHVKVPIGPDYLEVITALSSGGVNVNVTACATFPQAQAAWFAGARDVSFFFNRMKDAGIDAVSEIAEYRDYLSAEIAAGTKSSAIPEIICGSIRKPEDIHTCWDAGADIVTVSDKILRTFITHPVTDTALKQFTEDFARWRS